MNALRLLLAPMMTLCLSLLLATLARADIVHLKNGTKMEGKILSENSQQIVLQTRFGKAPIPRSRIERIERGKSPQEQYTERKAGLGAKDVNGRFELALYCKEKKLTREYKGLLKEILKIQPRHEGANRELGKIEYQGQWYTKKELELYKAKEKAQMEDDGFVLYKGKWMTKEESLEAQGYVQIDGEWISREEANRLKALKDFESTFGVPLTISDSEHFSVRNTRTKDDNDYLLDILEQGYEIFTSFVSLTEKEQEFLDFYKTHIYILDEPNHINLFITSGYIDRYKPPKNTKERYLDTTNFAYYFPMPVIVLSEGRHLKSGGDRETAQIGMVTVHVGQIFLRRIKRGGGLPGWAEAGIGHYFEGILNQYRTVSVIEYPHYEPPIDKWISDWESFGKWDRNLKQASIRQGLLSLRQMMETPVEELRVDSLAKSWSLVTFLLEERREKFFHFAREAKIRFRGERVSVTQAFDEAFAPESMEQLEKAWEEWLLSDKAPVIRVGLPRAGGVLR